MPRRAFLSLAMLLALLIAPFGRMAAAEAATMPHGQAPTAMAGHCSDMPAPDPDEPGHGTMTIDCLVACATIATPDAPALAAILFSPATPEPGRLALFIGLHPEADPPPPRLS